MIPDENTSDIRGARRALAESRDGAERTDRIVEASRDAMAKIRQARETNHFADKFRVIINGGITQ